VVADATPVKTAVVDVVDEVVVVEAGAVGVKLVEQEAVPAVMATTTVSPYAAPPMLKPAAPCPFASSVTASGVSTVR
jgi:hypothetical protein